MTNEEKILVEAIKAQQQVTPTTEVEGNISSWHIRLVRRIGTAEVWALFNGNQQESSPTVKSAVQQWRDEELAKGEKK